MSRGRNGLDTGPLNYNVRIGLPGNTIKADNAIRILMEPLRFRTMSRR